MADLLQVAAVLIHHEELQRRPAELRRAEAVPVAHKDNSPAGEWARTQVEYAVSDMVLAAGGPAELLAPVGRSQVGRELLSRQLLDLAGRDVNLVDISAMDGQPSPGSEALLQVVELDVVHRLPVERNHRV